MILRILPLFIGILIAIPTYGQKCRTWDSKIMKKSILQKTSIPRQVDVVSKPDHLKLLSNWSSHGGGYVFAKDKDDVYIRLNILRNVWSRKYNIDSNSNVNFVLENGETISLNPEDSKKGRKNIFVFANWYYMFLKLSPSDIDMMLKHSVSEIQVGFSSNKIDKKKFKIDGENYFRLPFKKKHQKRFKKNLKCISDYKK